MKNNIKSLMIGLLIVGAVSLNFNLKVFISIVNPVSGAVAESVQGEEAKLASSVPRPSTRRNEETPKAATLASPHKKPISEADLLNIVDLGVWEGTDSTGLAVSPDGRFIAIQAKQSLVESNRSVIRWIAISTRGESPPFDIGDGGDPMMLINPPGLVNGYELPENAQWLPDSQSIIYRANVDGAIQLWRSWRDGSRQQQLTHNAADVKSFQIAENGETVWFITGRARSRIKEVFADEARRGYLYDDRFISDGGARAPITDEESSQEADVLWKLDLKTRKQTRASDAEKVVHTGSRDAVLLSRPHAQWVRRSPSRRTTAWLDDIRVKRDVGLFPPHTVSASLDENGSKPIICVDTRCTGRFKGLWLTDQEEVLFLRWANGLNYGPLVLYRWNPRSDVIADILTTNDWLEGCTYSSGRLLCSRETAISPRTVVSISIKNGAIETLYDPNPQMSLLQFGEVTQLTWQDLTGREGFGHLVKPIGFVAGQRYPLIIVQYRSRGFLRGGVGDEYPIHVFAAKGFAVLSFNRPDDWELYANSTTVDDLMHGLWKDLRDRRNVLSVLEAGIDLLKNMGIVDPAKVGITGLSDGGSTGTFALIHSSERFAAASLAWTHWNPINYYLSGPAHQRDLEKWGFPEPTDEASLGLWRDISPALNASRILTPLLIQVSDDELMPETQTFTALRRVGTPVEMHVFPNEYHLKSQPAHRFNIYRRNVQWFQFWLCDIESDDPVDARQYDRWRSLRAKSRVATSRNDLEDDLHPMPPH